MFNQLTKIMDRAGKVTTIILDATGNPLIVTDPLGGQRVRTYNSQGLVLTEMDENGKTTTFTYDAQCNVDTMTDPEGHGIGVIA